MTETMEAVDYSKYVGQKVIVQVNLPEPNDKGETLIEVEGKAESVNAMAVLIKPKGRTSLELIEMKNVESIEFAPEDAKKLKQKTLAVIEYGKARQHLVDRHGSELSAVNDMTEEKALEHHAGIDHDDLGHVHGDTSKSTEANGEADNSDDSASE